MLMNRLIRFWRNKRCVAGAVGMALAWVAAAGGANVFVVPPETPGVAPDGLFQTWATAATNIQTAINAIDITGGNTVFVSNGVYVLTDELSVTKGVYLRSLHDGTTDRINTIIDGGNYEGRASSNRCITINHAQAVVDGFTFRNGLTSGFGGGVNLKRGLLTNCLVVSNTATGGAFGGGGIGIDAGPSVVTHCEVLYNKAQRYGGGVYVGKSGVGEVNNCLIAFNESSGTAALDSGGGYTSAASAAFVCRNSVIRKNTVYSNGGGVLLYNGGGLVENCEILDNYQSPSSGYRSGSGVTIYGAGTVRNCLIAGNSSLNVLKSAVQLYGFLNSTGVVENCTIVSNTPRGVVFDDPNSASGAFGLIRNSIIVDNIRPDKIYDTNYVAHAKLVFNNCCTTPLPDTGENNITSAPQFVNPAVTNYQLMATSPCINVGTNQPWMDAARDLVGRRRIDAFGNVVDMGCYEWMLQEQAADVTLPEIDLWTSGTNIFTITDEADTEVFWRGVPLITAEELSFYPGEALSSKVEGTVQGEARGWNVVNTWTSDENLPFRKELAVTETGTEVELNFRVNHPSFHQQEGISSLTYKIKLPIENFTGMTYTAICGRTFNPETVEGSITDETPDKVLFSTRYIAFEGNGRNLIFDFNPEGVQTYGGGWVVTKTPGYLEMSFGKDNTDYGGMMDSKLRIYEGDADDYLKRHAYREYAYFSELPVETQFCFGAPKHGTSFIQAGNSLYNEERGFGWNREVVLDSLRDSGALYSAASGNGDANFKWRLARPGLYVFTVRCAAYQQACGAFSLNANETEIFANLAIAPFTLKNISWTQWVENGKMDLSFSGKDWTISSVSAQLLQHSFEDFKFRRGYWIVEDLFEPHPVGSSSCFSEPVDHVVAISQMALPKEPIVDPLETPVIQKCETVLPDQNAPNMRWRYNATIGTLGPSNSGTLSEFDTPELIGRRLQQIKASNVNTVLLNGLLSRLTFPNQHARVETTIKDIAAIGHTMNMKILDHQDLTLLWNMGTAFRVMAEKIGMTQRTVDGNLPTRGFCLTNQEFKEFYFQWLTDFIRETDIDGIMIDEACYHGDNFCGCVDCRSKFTADTGLILPLDETSPLLQNKNSKLWKTWLLWRTEAVCDWHAELRRQVMTFKPDFTFMKYTTHSGFSSNVASLGYGSGLSESARVCDFLGTEIMSRNVMQSYRAVHAFRKAKNSLRNAFNSPIFGLVYPLQSTNFAYFGWAMNNMNAQVTWMSGTQNDNSYTHFSENMDHRLARPLSDIAIFYSVNSMNWPRLSAFAPEPLGLSQALTDRHIMHDFFMEQSINDTFLKQYRTVVLPFSCCISTNDIGTFLKYASDGGTLYVTGTAGLYDQLGDLHASWQLGNAAGIKHKGKEAKLSKAAKIAITGQTPLDYDRYVLNILCDPENPATVLASTLDATGQEVQPLLVERNYGKGRIVYCATQLSGYNNERESSSGSKWDFAMDEALDQFNAQVLATVIGTEELGFTPVTIPRQVLTSVYRQTTQGRSSTMVHLLNATGVKRLAVGEIVPDEISEPAWPALAEDLVFEISLPTLKQAYAVSPDHPGREPVPFQRIGENRYRITVAKTLLTKYTIIFMEGFESVLYISQRNQGSSQPHDVTAKKRENNFLNCLVREN